MDEASGSLRVRLLVAAILGARQAWSQVPRQTVPKTPPAPQAVTENPSPAIPPAEHKLEPADLEALFDGIIRLQLERSDIAGASALEIRMARRFGYPEVPMNAAFPVLGTALLLLALRPAPAIAWGCKGHQAVALIAEKHLPPGARHLVDQLLSENPVDPQLKRYCDNPSGDPLADASTWPDDVRKERNNGPWHYINIPRSVARGPIDLYCGGEGCISKAIADQLAILNDKSAAPPKRAEALRYLVHFLGDLHMPLHASTNNDEGGNCVPVRYFRRRPQESQGSFTPNLHALWDTAILERDSEGAEAPENADRLADRFSSDFAKWQAAGIHVEDWVWESHDLAETVAYGARLPSVPRETPAPVHSCGDADNIGERMLHLNLFAGETYQQAAAPLVEQRVAQAGLRLALLLNEAAAALAK